MRRLTAHGHGCGRSAKPIVPYDAGFTLIEIVVSLALLGLLMGGLYSLFAGAISAWESAEQRAELEQNLRVMARSIAMDLENMTTGPDAVLAAVGPDEEGGGYLRFSRIAPKPAYGGVVEIAYQLTDAGLERLVYPASVLAAEGDAEGPQPFEDEILSDLARRFEPLFYVDGEWLEELPADMTTPPLAVQVRVWAGFDDDETKWRTRTVEVNIRAGAAWSAGGAEP